MSVANMMSPIGFCTHILECSGIWGVWGVRSAK